MKAITFLCSLALVAPALAIDQTGTVAEKSNAVVVTVEADDNGNVSKNVKVIRIGDDGTAVLDGANDAHAMFISAVANDGDAPHVNVFTHALEVDPNRGWLGVALGHTVVRNGETEEVDKGVVVLNVVSDSPAEQAGLQKGDVITAVNGEAISTEVSDLAKMIGGLGAGTTVDFSILRDGTAMDISATLASPRDGGIQWLHTPDIKFRDKVIVNPHIGMVNPQGKMTILNAGDLDNLPAGVLQFLDNSGTSVQVAVRDGNRVIEIQNDDNGEVLDIRQEGDGPITVKRYASDDEDNAVEAQYADAAALEAADADAFEIYNRSASGAGGSWVGDNGQTYTFDLNVSVDPSDFDFSDLHNDLIKSFGSSVKIDPAEMAKIHESLQDALGNFEFHFEPGQASGFFGKASRTFKVQPNGNIEMTVRKGDTEVVTVFTDENDLAARDPEAFDRYDAVMNADLAE
ncbi:MAG: PDZ domain-containing protein [Phycisphaerales bacterium]|nr:PDZ domain-containing protein [Phycisphaerales bacterium]